jgi:uncharacterized protein (DUF4415 family)
MKKQNDEAFLMQEFDFSKARRATPKETEKYRKAIEAKLGVKRKPRGRPRKPAGEKFKSLTIRLDPRVIAWAKREAKRKHIGYQTVLNQELLRLASAA